MKKIILLLSLLIPAAGFSQQYAIDWHKIAGGGGTSTGAVYSVSGTIGQADAGRMSGGNFSLEGGFWGIVAAIQTPGSPLLRIALTGSNTILVAWPAPATGFVLQQSSGLGNPNWQDATNVPIVAGGERQVVVPASGGSRFFRLRYP